MATYIQAPGVDGFCCPCLPTVCHNCVCSPPVITSPLTASVASGSPFSYQITATNSPTSFGAAGLPAGLSVNTGTGLITGSTTSTGPHNITISATNACGTGSAILVLTVTAACPTAAPTMLCDSISSTKNRCGFSPLDGIGDKKYLVKTLSGSLDQIFYSPGIGECSTSPLETQHTSFSGNCTYDRLSCVLSNNGKITVDTGGGHSETCDAQSIDERLSGSCQFIWDTGCIDVETITATHRSVAGTEDCCDGGTFWEKDVGEVFEDLSSEYTDALLIADAIALLPSYPNTWAGSCSASFSLNPSSVTIQRFRYKFSIPVGSLTGVKSYVITWMEGSTARSYTWNCSDTETPIYEVSNPLINGSISVSSVVTTISCETQAPTITSADFVLSAYNVPFYYQVTTNACATATSYSISGTLPTGLSFNTSTGEITGTPTAYGAETISVVTIHAINAAGSSAAFTLNIYINGTGGSSSGNVVNQYIDPSVVWGIPKTNVCDGNMWFIYKVSGVFWRARFKAGTILDPAAFFDSGCVAGEAATGTFQVCNFNGPAVCSYINIQANCTGGIFSGSYQWAIVRASFGSPPTFAIAWYP